MEMDKAKAIAFAIRAHKGQKYGDHPYAIHLADTAAVASSYGLSDKIIVCCWLHDTLEDTDTTKEDIEREFGKEVAYVVFAVTDEPGANRKARKAKTYDKTAANKDAVLVKLCDRIANIDACLRDENAGLLSVYRNENAEFFKRLSVLERGQPFHAMGIAILNKLA